MKRIIQSASALVLAAVAVGTASAGNVKSYHAQACHIINGGQGSGGVTGASAWEDNVQYLCPLIRDEHYYATQVQAAYIEVSNAVSGSSISCRFETQTEDTGGTTVDYQTLSTSSQGYRQLGKFSPDTSSGNEGSYSVTCTLGRGDYIYHIYVDEKN